MAASDNEEFEARKFRMKAPTQCVLWDHPELIDQGPMHERFELLDTFEDESHLWRYLLKCRECGQKYFFEFYEEIDWEDGDDPQYCKYIPVESAEQIAALKESSPIGLFLFTPRLDSDSPKGAKKPKIGWVR